MFRYYQILQDGLAYDDENMEGDVVKRSILGNPIFAILSLGNPSFEIPSKFLRVSIHGQQKHVDNGKFVDKFIYRF